MGTEQNMQSIYDEIEENYRKSDMLSRWAIRIGILTIVFNVIAGLDKIAWLADYVLSCLR